MGRASGVANSGLGRGLGVWPAAGGTLAVLIGGAALAQAVGDFPASTSEADILHWVAARTSIPRASILMLEPNAVVSLASRSPPGAQGTPAHAEVREELIGPDAKTRSALFSVDLDCAGHRFRIVQRRTFPLPDLQGEGQVNPQPAPWTEVAEGAPVAKAWAAVCTSGFVFPFAGQQTASAATVVQGPIPTAPSAIAPVAKAAAPPAPRAPVRKLAAASSPPAPKPSPPPEAAASPVAGGPFEAVLGAYTVKDNAVAASAKLDKVLSAEMAGHRKSLVAATVKGQAYTVLTVSGFANPTDAADFCRAAKSIPLACLVKKGG